MDVAQLNRLYTRLKFKSDVYHTLMRKRVQRILLVATFYDAFILEQDGNPAEQLLDEYRQLDLSAVPKITSVPTGELALQAIAQSEYDLVITMLRIGDVDPWQLSRRIKEQRPGLPVVLLLNNEADVDLVDKSSEQLRCIDDVFLWTGDSMLFLAMVKSVEDRLNVRQDTKHGFVRVILLVGDKIQYYSTFLPLLYGEILKQTHRVMGEELNTAQKMLRMRGRPKVVLAHDYEQAMARFQRHQDALLCVIADLRFPRGGASADDAGLRFVEHVRRQSPNVPVLLQSPEPRDRERALALGATFLPKQSKHQVKGLKTFLAERCGFGDFVFRDAAGAELDRASTLVELEQKLARVPIESVAYASDHHHFSAWLLAHGEIQLAQHLRPVAKEDFSSPTALKEYLSRLFHELRVRRTRGKIVEFQASHPHVEHEVLRLAGGSLGGKGRGLAFLNAFLSTMYPEERFPDVTVTLPRTAIVGTDEYDEFLERHRKLGLGAQADDEATRRAFLAGGLSAGLRERLCGYLRMVDRPIAVRSSSLLEDSQSKPFAGVYQTLMVPNNSPDAAVRLRQLEAAIRLVYASVYLRRARGYLESVSYEVDQEKMAVVLQEVVGRPWDGYFYPHFAGVAESWNFYPAPFMQARDGVATLCVGLGKYVVEGGTGVRFCPACPSLQTHLADELPRDAQSRFWAVDLRRGEADLSGGEESTMAELPLEVALGHGSIDNLVSTFDAERWELVDGNLGRGPRVVTFADVLKNNRFPVAGLLAELLDLCATSLGVPVELEFAVDLEADPPLRRRPSFNLLQVRPLGQQRAETPVEDLAALDRSRLLLYSSRAMGNGAVTEVSDVVYVLPEAFDTTKTLEIKADLAAVNSALKAEGRGCILIGPGRWGTRDRFLGVPVGWDEIAQARVIVELGLEGLPIESSQGTHFFHNLVALNVGYFSVPQKSKAEYLFDDEWLMGREVVRRTAHVAHLRCARPLVVHMDGRHARAAIFKE